MSEEQTVEQEETGSETLDLESVGETGEEESVEPEGEEEPEESAEADEAPGGDEETELDWDAWRAQEELPDSIDSPEALAASYRESLMQMKRGQTDSQRLEQVEQVLRSRGFHGGVNDLLSGQAPQQVQPQGSAPQQTQQQQTYFQPDPAGAVVESMVKSGSVGAENEGSFRAVARVIDQALTPQLQLAEKVMSQQSAALQMLYSEVRNVQWNQLDPKFKTSIDRAQADILIAQGAVKDYNEAAQWMAFKGQGVLGKVADNAERRGRTNAKKKLRRGKAIRKGRESIGGNADFSKYLNPDGSLNSAKLAVLPQKKSDELIAAYAKKHG